MTQTEALRLALEALELAHPRFGIATEKHKQAITAIKAALEAKDEPVPVAIVEVFGKDWRLDYMALPVGKHKLYAQQYTYTTPPQRTWVKLTEEEIKPCWYEACQTDLELTSQLVVYFARAIEAKLKEKNNG